MNITADIVLKMPLCEIALDHYLPEKKKRRQPDTVYGYESSINLHVLPRWGEMTIEEISHDAVQDWVDELCKSAGIGGAQKAYKCLRQIIRWAMDKWSLFIPEVTRGIEFERQTCIQAACVDAAPLKTPHTWSCGM